MVGGVTARSRHHEHKLAETVRHHSAASQEHVKPSDEVVGRNRKVASTYAYAIFTGDGVRGLPVPGGERGRQCDDGPARAPFFVTSLVGSLREPLHVRLQHLQTTE